MHKKNFIFTAISIGSRLVAGLLLFVFLARLWGPEDFGMYSFAFGLSMTLVLIVDFGFASYLLREIGAEPLNIGPVFREGLRLKLLLIIPFLLVSALTFWFFNAKLPILLFVPMLLSALMLSFSEYCIAPLRALGRYDIETGIITVANIINFGAATSVAWLGGDLIDIAWVSFGCRVQYLITAAVALYKVAPTIMNRSDLPSVIRSFIKLVPYGSDGALSTGWNQLDIVIVGSIFGVAALGVYSAGQKIVQGLYTLAQVVGNVMIPRLSRLYKNIDFGFYSGSRITIWLLTGIGILLALPMISLSDFVVLVIFGKKYGGLGELLPYFGMILISRYISAGTGVVLTAAGKQNIRALGNFCGLSIFFCGALLVWFCSLGLIGMLVAYFLSTLVMAFVFHLNLPNSSERLVS